MPHTSDGRDQIVEVVATKVIDRSGLICWMMWVSGRGVFVPRPVVFLIRVVSPRWLDDDPRSVSANRNHPRIDRKGPGVGRQFPTQIIVGDWQVQPHVPGQYRYVDLEVDTEET